MGKSQKDAFQTRNSLYSMHPDTTDPILMPLAGEIFPDVTTEYGTTIPYDSDREQLVMYGGLLLRDLAARGLIDLHELQGQLEAQRTEAEGE